MEHMDRKVLITYLQSLKNLEVLRHQLANLYHQHKEEQRSQQKLLETKSHGKFPAGAIVGLAAAALLVIAAVAIWLWGDAYKQGAYSGFILWMVGRTLPIFLGIMVLVVLAGSHPLRNIREYNEEVRSANNHNEQVRQRTPAVKAELQRLDQVMAYDEQEYAKVKQLLEEAYSFNVIPAPYRDLEHMLYISDYMSTSNATLEDTLLHSHMEDGIAAIASRLDIIVRQNVQMIRALQVQAAQNATMLQQLNSIGADARMCAHFSRVNSYIAQADYLKH